MSKKLVGLSSEEVERSLRLYGDNSLKQEKSKGFISKFFSNLNDPIIRILLAALILQIVFTFGNCNFLEIFGIVSAVLISTLVSTVSEYRSEKTFERLEKEATAGRVAVIRDGMMVEILSTNVVVGDIVYLRPGDIIQADGTVIDGSVTVDQSALNGESAECRKSPGNDSGWDLSSVSKVFRGTHIISGSGLMSVGRVGMNTYYGLVAKDVQMETRTSPLKLRLGKLAGQVSKLGLIVALFVGVAYLFNSIVVDNGFYTPRIVNFLKNTPILVSTLVNALTLMITVVVVAAPEGLPMMITVVLSANMKKMLTDNIHVKKLVGIDTAGTINLLFTDKTGTLTEGKLKCDRIITSNGIYKSIRSLKDSGHIYNTLLLNAKYNTDVVMQDGVCTGGNSTDKAIYDYFSECEADIVEVVNTKPFSSSLKYSSITLKNGKTIIKGAAELLINKSKYYLLEDGSRCEFEKKRVLKLIEDACHNGERVLAVAIEDGTGDDSLTLVGILVLKDKLRNGVNEAVKEVLDAGVQVVMITGDNKETAIAIAKECGIFRTEDNHIALGSTELREMSDYDIKTILPRLRVISRALPQDKTRLVRLAQELELVVGMTGDGINDAPSLKLADVGFAMGSGTDIAKSSADIVILDDSFSAIDKAILYGRNIFKSIRKFITFQLVMNFAACGITLIGQLIGIDTPITIVQMLWVNIIMDTLGGLAFAGEAPMHYYMKEKPPKRDEAILTPSMIRHVIISGAFTLLLCVMFLVSPRIRTFFDYNYSPIRFQTAFYALFIFLGIFNSFAARSDRVRLLTNISKNPTFVLIMAFISFIQIIMIYYGGAVFRCTPLSYGEIIFVIGIAALLLPFEIIRRIIAKLK